MYSVITFSSSGDVEAIPSTWVTSGKSMCKFPNNLKGSSLTKAIERCLPVQEDWPDYGITVLRETDDYIKARRKCRKVENQISDLSSTDVEGSSRKRTAPKRFYEDDSDDNDDVICRRAKRLAGKALEKRPAADVPLLPSLPSLSMGYARESRVNETFSEEVFPLGSPVAARDLAESPGPVQQREISQEVLTHLAEIKMIVTANSIAIKKVMKALDPNTTDITLDKAFPIPLHTFEDVQEVEKLLRITTKVKNLTAYLSTLGGYSVKEVVGRMLERVMDHSLALEFNWSGRPPKRGFGVLKLVPVIKEAAKRYGGSEADVERAIKIWFRNASDRQGGRKKREDEKRE